MRANEIGRHYSRTGPRQQIAGEIAAACGAYVDAVSETNSRIGPLEYPKAGLDALRIEIDTSATSYGRRRRRIGGFGNAGPEQWPDARDGPLHHQPYQMRVRFSFAALVMSEVGLA